MGHYAKVVNGTVTNVIVAEKEFFDTFVDSTPGEWIQTSYNTIAGKHVLGGTPLRKNFAGVGYTYDKDRDAFIAPKPFPSWTLNEETCQWEPPVAKPVHESKIFEWNEGKAGWVDVTPPDAPKPEVAHKPTYDAAANVAPTGTTSTGA